MSFGFRAIEDRFGRAAFERDLEPPTAGDDAARGGGEARALAWLIENTAPGETLLEAHGASYTDAGRFSMASGIPALLGWRVHEWLWLGGRREVNERRAQVRAVYELPTRR